MVWPCSGSAKFAACIISDLVDQSVSAASCRPALGLHSSIALTGDAIVYTNDCGRQFQSSRTNCPPNYYAHCKCSVTKGWPVRLHTALAVAIMICSISLPLVTLIKADKLAPPTVGTFSPLQFILTVQDHCV